MNTIINNLKNEEGFYQNLKLGLFSSLNIFVGLGALFGLKMFLVSLF